MHDFHGTFRDLLHAANLRHGTDGFTSPPKESMLRIFSPLKIRRLRPGLNPRTWVPKASTLPLDHRSRLSTIWHKFVLAYFSKIGNILTGLVPLAVHSMGSDVCVHARTQTLWKLTVDFSLELDRFTINIMSIALQFYAYCFIKVTNLIIWIFLCILIPGGDCGSTVVKVLCYKSEGRWFDPSWYHWNFSLT